MKEILATILPLLLSLIMCQGCIPNTPVNKDYQDNLDALWTIINEKYCFVDQKSIDWDQVHAIYTKKLQMGMKQRGFNDLTFFNLLNQMLSELKDGHVNLISSFNTSRYDGFIGDETEGLNIYQRKKYLGKSYYTTGGVLYNILIPNSHRHIKIGYMIYNSFMSSPGDMHFVLSLFKQCNGVIIDVRNNGGGLIDNADKLASYFVSQKELVGYSSHKTGPGRQDYSPLKPLYITPNKSITYTDRPVIVLQDRGCYSSTNDFINKVSVAPNVITVGLKSGGGGGMPAMSELPNGWRVRYSAVRGYDRNKKSIEEGIEPMIKVKNESYNTNPYAKDSIMITAVKVIISLSQERNSVES